MATPVFNAEQIAFLNEVCAALRLVIADKLPRFRWFFNNTLINARDAKYTDGERAFRKNACGSAGCALGAREIMLRPMRRRDKDLSGRRTGIEPFVDTNAHGWADDTFYGVGHYPVGGNFDAVTPTMVLKHIEAALADQPAAQP